MDPAASSSLPSPEDDLRWMQLAYAEAELAAEEGEVPVGAVIVSGGRILGRGHNRTEALQDPTAHAEILAITAAANTLVSWRIEGSSLYVTLEPCVMCAGAAFWTQVGKIVYGASDDKRGYTKTKAVLLHPKTEVVRGVLEQECSQLLIEFFKRKREDAAL